MADLDDTEAQELLAAVKRGDIDALARLIEKCRGLLNAHAEKELDSRLRVRASVSDIYQRTCLSAVNQLQAFRGNTIGEFIQWLKAVQQHNLLDLVRDNKAGIRDIRKEHAPSPDDKCEPVLRDDRGQTASQVLQANEELDAIHQAISTLPDRQQQVVQLRLLEKTPIRAIAEMLQTSEDAVAGLYKRGLATLRERLQPEEQASV